MIHFHLTCSPKIIPTPEKSLTNLVPRLPHLNLSGRLSTLPPSQCPYSSTIEVFPLMEVSHLLLIQFFMLTLYLSLGY